MTPDQCRAGRALIKWTQQQLADAAGIGIATLTLFESGSTDPRPATIQVLQRALVDAGIVLLGDGEMIQGGAGVRLRKA
ncbi:helix-turn-helix transcriptional regulator [Mesorhizobium sp. BR115XR7A]|uniref:helix-turn-helix domain-containing protein n=1 Tax=Mesorhizobium sp. BR115XR7A TaxID=2876645 RepID=UPI001CCD0EA8|nr:helix-turn-helix transcriptional regulator [Mesorhizobium sp. BR115XR7A]MBZ9909205.1 helix-turn-helix transcriptional regulator [Mesorhizobium sp. BR115XR7A]MBZ9930447.1 helix-turn-helix transcriptional regulator [Mesorhizobium sp. BR1-1-5]